MRDIFCPGQCSSCEFPLCSHRQFAPKTGTAARSAVGGAPPLTSKINAPSSSTNFLATAGSMKSTLISERPLAPRSAGTLVPRKGGTMVYFGGGHHGMALTPAIGWRKCTDRALKTTPRQAARLRDKGPLFPRIIVPICHGVMGRKEGSQLLLLVSEPLLEEYYYYYEQHDM